MAAKPRANAARLLAPRQRTKAGLLVTYGFADGPAGPLLVACTPRGICRIAAAQKGRPPGDLNALRRDHPGATFSRDDAAIRKLLPEILDAARGRRRSSPLNLDLPGTDFQRRVWKKLLRVRVGATISYAALARAAGNPRAARAVGNAVGRNPVGILIPCHRVIREDGSLGGYAWGPRMKQRLLAWESSPGPKIS